MKLLLFDDDCNLCRKTAEKLKNLKEFNFVQFIPLQKFIEKNPDFDYEELKTEIHLINEGQIFRGKEAIEELVSNLPNSKPYRWQIKKLLLEKTALPSYRLMRTIRRYCSACTG